MSTQPPNGEFSLFAGAAELLDRVEPLWSQLRQHHADLAPQWRASLLATSFADRRAEISGRAARGLLVLLATRRDCDIGYCVSTLSANGTGEVDSLFVAAEHRGRGVGHALMAKTMEWFANNAVGSIAVELIGGNDAAQRFYARHGFAPRTVRMMRAAGGVA